MKRRDTEFQGDVNLDRPSKGWDPEADAMYCMDNFVEAVEKCNADGAIQSAACVYGKAEAAFYEDQITEELMNEIKNQILQPALIFNNKCKCNKKD